MPAIQVARTDTFEQQRQKINQIGSAIFNVTAGGSDLSTGNLKLGDGTKDIPSLAFISNSSLGIYKSGLKSVGYVNDGKKIFDISATELTSYKNFNLQKNTLITAGLTALNLGSGYDPGSYTNISILGGSGDFGTLNVTVEGFSGTVLNYGTLYKSGSYSGIPLVGGSGSNTTISFAVDSITGDIISYGSGYGDGSTTFYEFVPLTGGSGSGAQASFFVNTSTGAVSFINVSNEGSGYLTGDILSVDNSNLGGSGSGFQYKITSNPGVIKNVNFINKGSGYSPNQTLTLPGITTNVSTTLSTSSSTITVSSVSGIVVGSTVSKISGTGVLASNTTVSFIDAISNAITLSANPTTSGAIVLSFKPPYLGNSNNNNFSYRINTIGNVNSYTVNSAGSGYQVDDLITVSPGNLTQPITYPVYVKNTQLITFVQSISSTYFTVGNSITNGLLTSQVLQVNTSGSSLQSILVENILLAASNTITKVGDSINYTINTATTGYRFYIDTGSGQILTPNLTLYVGSTYIFNLSDSSNSGHRFALSKFRDGIWAPSLIENVSATLSTTSDEITVSSTANILPGMEVTVSSLTGGSLPQNTFVESVINLTTLKLSKFPSQSGSATLKFNGVEFTDGVLRTSNQLKISVSESTPNLYYYCSINNPSHVDEGGTDNNEALITINSSNPKVFGSGFQLRVDNINSENVISASINDGELSCLTLRSDNSFFDNCSVSNSINSLSITSSSLNVSSITSPGALSITSGSSVNINSNLNVGSNIQVNSTSGNITTSGTLKTTSSLNVNDILTISNNIISTSSGNNIVLSPPIGRVAKINSTTALTIPSGTTAQRPTASIIENGSIRFNTDTNQYEGYSGTTSSWSSLGGVRDLDGNTYITAEFTIGSNDNTLWFYNDNINTVKFTPEYQEFVSVKKVRSVNTSAPTYVNWAANTPVTVGQYLKYRNNIYEVVTAGVTGSSGNEPISTTGTNFANGTATLKFFISAVGPLTFEEISEVRIAPDGGTSLSINSDLRFATNVISTDTNDLLLRPNSGKKVTVDAKTSLVLPVGTTNERGAPVRGSVRFNTTILQYEGYDGANWSSLGGVRDVDGNTYIIPELTPGGNQNILYFYNNGSNTLRVTENEIQLDTIDTITSPTSNALNLEASLVTFNNLAASIDTSSATTTFISTTKDNLDLGLSSGIVNDPLLRLSDTGDIFYNLGFGTGVYNGIKIFDKGLKELELADYKIFTEDVTLTKNTIDAGSSIAYDPSIHRSAKVQIVAHNETTGDKEFLEYSVIDKGSDIFHTDFGNVKTGAELISSVFDFDANNRVRVTFTLDSAISAGNVVKVTVISNIIKR